MKKKKKKVVDKTRFYSVYSIIAGRNGFRRCWVSLLEVALKYGDRKVCK